MKKLVVKADKQPEIQPKYEEVVVSKTYGPFYFSVHREEIHRIIYQCCNVELVDFYKNQTIVDTLRSSTDLRDRNRDLISSLGRSQKSLGTDRKIKASGESDTLLRNSIDNNDRLKPTKEMNLINDYNFNSGPVSNPTIMHGEFKFVTQCDTLKQSLEDTLSDIRRSIS